RAFLQAQDERLGQKRRELGVSDEVAAIEGLTPGMLVALGEAGVKSLDDLADLSGDELVSRADGILRNFSLGETEANAIMMPARAHGFAEEEAAKGQLGDGDAVEGDAAAGAAKPA